MDFKKLAKFIIILGIVIFAVGGLMYITNLPVHSSKGGWGGFFEETDKNIIRKVKRGDAGKVMVGGVVVAFIGFAIGASAKEQK